MNDIIFLMVTDLLENYMSPLMFAEGEVCNIQ